MKNSMQNEPGTPGGDVAERIAQRTLASRGPDYSSEVRRLLDAGREVMARCGTSSRPRVADIVSAAGLSNDAFYRHFASKDDLVAAIIDDGAERLHSYLSHQMGKESSPTDRVRRWVEGVMAQADDEAIARTTLAVLWNGGSLGSSDSTSRRSAAAPLGQPPRRAVRRARQRRRRARRHPGRPRRGGPDVGLPLGRHPTHPRRDRPPRAVRTRRRPWRAELELSPASAHTGVRPSTRSRAPVVYDDASLAK